MTAVRAAPMPLGNHRSEKDTSYETSPPGFTAVNGQDSVTNGGSSANDSPRTTDSTIKVGGDYRETRGSAHPSSRPPTPPTRSEDENHELTNGNHKEHQKSISHDSSPAAHKRKRSQSDDGDISSSPNSHYNNSPSQMGDRSIHTEGRYYGSAPPDSITRRSSHDVTRGPEARHSHGPNGLTHSHTSSWSDRGQAVSANHHSHGRHLEQSEAILREALQRDSQLHDTSNRSWGVPTRSEGDSADGEQYGHYSQDGTPTGSGPGNPKRKRVFSNRTKTGCLTCRRRKKKCDEGQPQCNNCVRGGFQCEGYSTRNTWSKPLNTKAPVPLQAKDGFPDVTDHGYKADDNSPRQGRSSLNSREGIATRPIVVDDNDHQLHAQLTASPTSAGPRSRGSYPGQAWPNPTNPSYLSDRGQPKQDYLPSFSEIARDPNKPEYRAMAPMREISHPGHNTSQPPPPPPPPQGPPPPTQAPPPQWSPYPPHGQPDYRQAYHQTHHSAPAPSHAPHADFQNTARMALNIEQQQSATRSSTTDESEKTKMIRGQAFKRSDPILAADRLRCKAALQRFNNAGMVDQTADTTSWNILKQVLSPTPTTAMAPKDKPVGSLGPGTVIDTPFDCEYGYNIKIGEDVEIGRNCTIVDVCPVIIGQKTSIGRNVSIISGGPGTDNVDRKGVNSTWQGRAITIESDVIIGEGSYIYQGVRLGARCTIEPGSVVKHNVLADQRFGPPASGPIQLGEIGPRQGVPGR